MIWTTNGIIAITFFVLENRHRLTLNDVECNITLPTLVMFQPKSLSTYLLYYAIVTQHIKQLFYYNWLHSATCFGRYLAIIR